MIIDFHTHIFPDTLAPSVIPKLEALSNTCAQTDGTLAGLRTSMQGAGVECSVIQPVASAARQVGSCNKFAQKVNATYPDLLSFGAMHPDFTDYKAELACIKEQGIKGIKLHPNYQNTYFDDIRYQRIIDAASALDLIVLVHAGVDIGLPHPNYSTPQHAKHVIDAVQPTKLVLAHMGGWQMWGEVLDCLAGSGVYLDTAFCLGEMHYLPTVPPEQQSYQPMPEDAFLQCVAAFGADKILFGTDSPWAGQAESIAALRGMPLTDAQKDLILGGNAAQLLGL